MGRLPSVSATTTIKAGNDTGMKAGPGASAEFATSCLASNVLVALGFAYIMDCTRSLISSSTPNVPPPTTINIQLRPSTTVHRLSLLLLPAHRNGRVQMRIVQCPRPILPLLLPSSQHSVQILVDAVDGSLPRPSFLRACLRIRMLHRRRDHSIQLGGPGPRHFDALQELGVAQPAGSLHFSVAQLAVYAVGEGGVTVGNRRLEGYRSNSAATAPSGKKERGRPTVGERNFGGKGEGKKR